MTLLLIYLLVRAEPLLTPYIEWVHTLWFAQIFCKFASLISTYNKSEHKELTKQPLSKGIPAIKFVHQEARTPIISENTNIWLWPFVLRGGAVNPLYILQWVFLPSACVDTCEAHSLLRAVSQLFIPASVHLHTDKPAGDLLWTNLLVIQEHPYSDQWELTWCQPGARYDITTFDQSEC